MNIIKRYMARRRMVEEALASSEEALIRARVNLASELRKLVEEDVILRGLIAKVGRAAAKDWVEDMGEEHLRAHYRCPVCDRNDCDGLRVHGIDIRDMDALHTKSAIQDARRTYDVNRHLAPQSAADKEQNLKNLEAFWKTPEGQ